MQTNHSAAMLRKTDQDENVKSKHHTEDTGYGGSISNTLLEQTTEEATKNHLQDSELVTMPIKIVQSKFRQKFITPSSSQAPSILPRDSIAKSQNTISEFVYSPLLSPLPIYDSESSPHCFFTFDDGSAHSRSQESPEVKEEETKPTNQELVLPSYSSILHMQSQSSLTVSEDFKTPLPSKGPYFKPFLGEFGP